MFGLLGNMYILLLEIFNLLCAGILAGIEIAAHYGFHKSIISLDERPQIIIRQQLTQIFRWLVPMFFVPMALSGIGLTIITWATPGFCSRIAAITAIIVWIVVRIVITVPINSSSLEWNPDSPPFNWREEIDKVERFHIIGTWAAILAFVCFLVAMAISLL